MKRRGKEQDGPRTIILDLVTKEPGITLPRLVCMTRVIGLSEARTRHAAQRLLQEGSLRLDETMGLTLQQIEEENGND